MRRLVLVLSCALAGLALAVPTTARADVGFQGPSYSGTGTPTGAKRSESVLWWNDGSWWAHMWHAASADFHIFRLDATTQTWMDTGVTVETRPNTHSDVLWDGTHLYVASHEFVGETGPAVPGSPSYLFRLTYDPLTKTYVPDPGFPATITDYKTETLVVDKDSTGKLWATWQQDNRIYVNRTLGDDLSWGTPFALPVAPPVNADDSSALVAFGNRIGLMWSDQTSAGWGMWFTVHEDGQPDTVWSEAQAAIRGSGTADDHISLKVLGEGSAARVFAGIKTGHTSAEAPLFLLLARDPATGAWASHTVSRVADCPTRPLIVIDEENELVHAYATAPGPPTFACVSSGGAIYEKTSPLDAISFSAGAGTPVLEDSDSPNLNNVSSWKGNVDSTTGLALLAVNTSTRRYWHAFQPISAPPPLPSAEFTAAPTNGPAPLAVAFTDASSEGPMSWSWSFGDGGTSTARNPAHTYTAPGTYTVTLTVTNPSGTDTETKSGYITVTPAPDFTVSAAPAVGVITKGQSTTYTVTVNPQGGFSGPIDLAVSGLGANVTAAFSPSRLDVPGTTTATLTVQTTTSAKPGSRVLTITGTGGSLQRATTVTLQIKNK